MFSSVVILIVAAELLGAGAGADAQMAKELKRLDIPAKLLPKNARPLFLLRAEGEQIYKGEKKDGALQWVLDGPDAILLDYVTGKKVGTHSKGPKGPIWEGSTGSKAEGKVIAKAPAPNPNAVDWLLLEAKGDGGDGRFGKESFIARVDTWGGRPPAAAPKAGASAKVRYQATYVFFGK
jgi:hypothetical protein